MRKNQTPKFCADLNRRNADRNRIRTISTGRPLTPILLDCSICHEPIKFVGSRRSACDRCLHRRIKLSALNLERVAAELKNRERIEVAGRLRSALSALWLLLLTVAELVSLYLKPTPSRAAQMSAELVEVDDCSTGGMCSTSWQPARPII